MNGAVDKLFTDRRIKLWVVYVKTFDDMGWLAWSQQTEKISDFGTDDALLAIATDDRSFAFNVRPDDHRRLLDADRRHPPRTTSPRPCATTIGPARRSAPPTD